METSGSMFNMPAFWIYEFLKLYLVNYFFLFGVEFYLYVLCSNPCTCIYAEPEVAL